ncbi:excinuclease ABC subunit UvrC [Candidatus Micrarchaeota archaeon]|nr:excinuclease ABC subunit UvrC [Candidatus Micrarchaeota archaeon]
MIFDRTRYPDLPGVYIMKDAGGAVIYVGKAISLRSRLSQYFGKPGNQKTRLLVSQISSIDFLVTKTGTEALILESNLIKGYAPKYNMALKDSKHFSYLAITDEAFPRLLLARRNSEGRFRMKNARFYGPFVEGAKRAISARYLRKLFRIRICGAKLPKKDCLQHHLGNCDAPCIGAIGRADYGKNVDAVRSILEGKAQTKELMGSLAARMKQASDAQDYEKAASLRDQAGSLRIFLDRQRVESRKGADEDFIWFQRAGGTLYVQLLRSRNGVIGKAESHSMAIKEQEEPEISFCLQYYAELPDRVYSNLPPADLEKLNSATGAQAFIRPGREKARVLEIASKSLVLGKLGPEILRLKEALGLEHLPVIIEAFDISTLFGEESVGSMVRFVNGKSDKEGYRRFKIKGVAGQDDFAMMKEVVFRRYSRLLRMGGPLPDLVLIDGGAGQLHAAMDGMDEAGVRLPVAGLAKKEEEIYLPGRMDTLRLPRTDDGLKLLQQCRDEAHRFAIGFHRIRRRKGYKS